MEERRNQRDPTQQNQNQQPQQSQGDQRQPQQAQPGSEQRQQGQSEAGRAPQGGQQGGQQGGMSGAGQQQQFERQSGQQGGSGTDMRFADQIREHMDVIDQSGAHVGTVDHVEGDRIKLTRSSSGTGEHQYVPLSEVAGVERDSVRLRYRGDTTFGMEGGPQA